MDLSTSILENLTEQKELPVWGILTSCLRQATQGDQTGNKKDARLGRLASEDLVFMSFLVWVHLGSPAASCVTLLLQD